jgi:predicted  nucleic acid-binding Zn-ribbon protein
MAKRYPPEILYRETMEAARGEVQDLASEIRELRDQLEQLETRKKAVSDLFAATRRLMELSEDDDEGSPIEYEAIGLSEEEVSLIAYPDGNGRNRQA